MENERTDKMKKYEGEKITAVIEFDPKESDFVDTLEEFKIHLSAQFAVVMKDVLAKFKEGLR